MDHQKKKQLTQSVSFLQAHLALTPELLSSLKSEEVLTSEEVSTIQKDDTSSGKIIELVCLLKRKDNRTFSKFLQVLQAKGCETVHALLKNNREKPQRPDPRVLKTLETQLSDVAVQPAVLSGLAASFVLLEVHKDEVSQLADKVAHLQKSLRMKIKASAAGRSTESLAMTPPHTSDGRASEMSQTSIIDVAHPPSARPSPQSSVDVNEPSPQTLAILKEKNSIIRRKDEEYTQLRRVLADTQNDLQGVLDLNAQYLGIISHYNSLQLSVHHASSTMPKRSTAELQHKLEEVENKVSELTSDLEAVNVDLNNREKELLRLEARQTKYRTLLQVPSEADDAEVEEIIQRLLADGNSQNSELLKARDELRKSNEARSLLAERLTTLSREKEKIEFHLRQQELTIKKIKRQTTAHSTIHNAVQYIQAYSGEDRLAKQMKLPSIERIGSHIGLSAKPNRTNQQFCVFCRADYLPLKSQMCRIHYRPIRNGKWTCCRDDCHRSPGCLQVPHFYVEITVDRKVFLTDGGRYMELTYLSPNH